MQIGDVVVGAAIALVSSGATAWLTDHFRSRSDQSQWLRSERLAAYRDLYNAITTHVYGGDGGSVHDVNRAAGAVILLGPPSVSSLVADYLTTAFAFALARRRSSTDGLQERAEPFYKAERTFLEATSRELGALPKGQAFPYSSSQVGHGD